MYFKRIIIFVFLIFLSINFSYSYSKTLTHKEMMKLTNDLVDSMGKAYRLAEDCNQKHLYTSEFITKLLLNSLDINNIQKLVNLYDLSGIHGKSKPCNLPQLKKRLKKTDNYLVSFRESSRYYSNYALSKQKLLGNQCGWDSARLQLRLNRITKSEWQRTKNKHKYTHRTKLISLFSKFHTQPISRAMDVLDSEFEQFAEASNKVEVIVRPEFFSKWKNTDRHPYTHRKLYVAYLVGSMNYQLKTRRKGDNPFAGLREMINVYNTLLQRNIACPIKQFEIWKKLNEGDLAAYVQKITDVNKKRNWDLKKRY